MIELLLGVACVATPVAGRPTAPAELEQVPAADDPSAEVFDHAVVHEVHLALSDAARQALARDPWTYVEGDLTYDGEQVAGVGVRLKGKYGSFETLNGKAAFKVDINRYDPGRTFHGLEQLTLNNGVVDCSYVKQDLAYAAFAAAGLPETRTAFAWVLVNGEPYGLYVLVETPDDVWLDAEFSDGSGNLYDGKYIVTEDLDWVSLVDFTSYEQRYFDLEEGTDVGRADIRAVTAALDDAEGTPELWDDLSAVLDWDSVLRMMATEQWVGHLDGYWLNKNNYRVYFDPERDRALLVPWDMDYTFLADGSWGVQWDGAYGGRIMQACLDDARCRDELVARVDEVADAIDAIDLEVRLDDVAALINVHAAGDPRACGGRSSIEAQQEQVRAWLGRRSRETRSYWGLPGAD